jgi:hypothetical protein
VNYQAWADATCWQVRHFGPKIPFYVIIETCEKNFWEQAATIDLGHFLKAGDNENLVVFGDRTKSKFFLRQLRPLDTSLRLNIYIIVLSTCMVDAGLKPANYEVLTRVWQNLYDSRPFSVIE